LNINDWEYVWLERNYNIEYPPNNIYSIELSDPNNSCLGQRIFVSVKDSSYDIVACIDVASIQ